MAHHHNVSKVHCRDCDSNYQPLLNQSDVLGKNENQIAREIVDATEIKKVWLSMRKLHPFYCLL